MKTIIYLILISVPYLFPNILYSQYDDISDRTALLFCHDNDGMLKCYNDGDYVLNFEKNKLVNIISSDSLFLYTEDDNRIFIKTRKDSLITINLTAKGSLITYGENKLLIDTITPYMLFYKDTLRTFQTSYYVGGISIIINFHNSILYRISFALGKHFFKINTGDYSNGYKWNIEDTIPKKAFSLIHGQNSSPRLIYIYNYNQNVGVTFGQNYNSNKFNSVRSITFPYYTGKILDKTLIKYNKNGKANKRKSYISIKKCSCSPS